MKIAVHCTQDELERAKEAYAEGKCPCQATHCPFGADNDGTKCSFRCPLSWRSREDQLVYLEHHIKN